MIILIFLQKSAKWFAHSFECFFEYFTQPLFWFVFVRSRQRKWPWRQNAAMNPNSAWIYLCSVNISNSNALEIVHDPWVIAKRQPFIFEDPKAWRIRAFYEFSVINFICHFFCSFRITSTIMIYVDTTSRLPFVSLRISQIVLAFQNDHVNMIYAIQQSSSTFDRNGMHGCNFEIVTNTHTQAYERGEREIVKQNIVKKKLSKFHRSSI